METNTWGTPKEKKYLEMQHFPTEPIHIRSPRRRHKLKGWGHPRRMNNMGQSHPLAHSHTHTRTHKVTSQQITAALFLMGSISRIRPKIGAEGLGVQLPPLSHTPLRPQDL